MHTFTSLTTPFVPSSSFSSVFSGDEEEKKVNSIIGETISIRDTGKNIRTSVSFPHSKDKKLIKGVKTVTVKDSNVKVDIQVSNNTVRVDVFQPRIEHKFMNRFLRFANKFSYPLSFLGTNNMAKEAIESFSAITLVYEYVKYLLDFDDEKIDKFVNYSKNVFIIPGDGVTPRTGYMASLMYKGRVYSIDPIMREDEKGEEKRQNLFKIKGYGEDFELPLEEDCNVVLLHVHSHADLPKMWDKFKDSHPLIAYTLPCCRNINSTLTIEAQRKGIIDELNSPNKYFIYHNGKALNY